MIVRNLVNIFSIPELVKKIAFTLFILIVYRIGTFIPVAGINIYLLKDYMKDPNVAGGLFNFIDLFSAGSLSQCTLFALGIGPSITAGIIMQFAGFTIPSIEALSKEGEFGKAIINRYTRYLSLALAVAYSFGYALYLESIPNVVFNPGMAFKLFFVLNLVAGCMFVMWLGDQIKVIGIGNGSSMILFAGIVARFPSYFKRTLEAVSAGSMSSLIAFVVLFLFIILTACIVFLEKGDRKIPIHYARRVVGNKIFGGQSSYIPFKINTVGVMPVIFASSFLNMPLMIMRLLSKYSMFAWLSEVMNYKGPVYNILLFSLIVLLTYVYTALFFNPEDLAENMKKNNGFIPSIRPGKQTANYFDYVLMRIGFLGAMYLGILAVIPNIIPIVIPSIPFELGGTSLLIVVGVALEFIVQIEAYLLEHKYEGFLTPFKK